MSIEQELFDAGIVVLDDNERIVDPRLPGVRITISRDGPFFAEDLTLVRGQITFVGDVPISNALVDEAPAVAQAWSTAFEFVRDALEKAMLDWIERSKAQP